LKLRGGAHKPVDEFFSPGSLLAKCYTGWRVRVPAGFVPQAPDVIQQRLPYHLSFFRCERQHHVHHRRQPVHVSCHASVTDNKADMQVRRAATIQKLRGQ
jgi:hypothetical protein